MRCGGHPRREKEHPTADNTRIFGKEMWPKLAAVFGVKLHQNAASRSTSVRGGLCEIGRC